MMSPHSQTPAGTSELHVRSEFGPAVEVDTGRMRAAKLATPTPVLTGSMLNEYQLKESEAGQRVASGEVHPGGRTVLAPSCGPRDLIGVTADKGESPEQTAERWRPGHGRSPSPRPQALLDTHNTYLPLANLPDSQPGSVEVEGERDGTV